MLLIQSFRTRELHLSQGCRAFLVVREVRRSRWGRGLLVRLASPGNPGGRRDLRDLLEAGKDTVTNTRPPCRHLPSVCVSFLDICTEAKSLLLF